MLHLIEVGKKKVSFLIVLFCWMGVIGLSQNKIVLDWKIFHPIDKVWFDLGTSGSVQKALQDGGFLPDPFVGVNEEKYQWIEKYDWEFISSFNLNQVDYDSENKYIEFDGIDTYATLFINGKKLGKTNNSFHPFRFDLSGFCKEGKNEIKVVFLSPINYHKKNSPLRRWRLPAPNDAGTKKVASHSRKPQFQFGWDWAPRINTIGFWNPVVIELFENNKIINKQIKIEEITETKAVVNYKLSLSHKPTGELFLKSLFFNERILLDEITSSTSFAIKDPILWWPRGYGEAYMYDDTLQLLDETGVVLQVIPISFGVRSSELRQVKDSIGTSYEIWVNGQYVFCKGANYIPHEVEISKINKENTIAILKTAKDANMNMIRVWGGGYYPADYFYDYCDENGIMIWQDFMFACAMYPDYKEYLSTVEEEFDYQIPRISSHASVVLFNGNNEVDIAWNNWGFQIQYALVRRKQKRIQHAYDHLFREVLADKVADISKIPYIHTSPLSNWGKDELYNHGSQHYWGVWHGRDPIEDFGKKSGRFNAEYGFQSFPQLSTINKYATEEEKDLKNEVMKNHQKSYVGNGMIKKQNEILYGKSKDFDEFVYHSQLTQAKAVGIAIAAHRLKAPICSGTIYWQLNDCWPASTWSSIDYFNNWKALHYQAKNDYESVAVVEKIEELNKETYFLISDFPQSTKVSIKCSVYDLRGNSIISKSASYDLSFLDKIDLSSEFKLNTYKNENFLVQFEWVQNDRIQTRKFTHLSGERPKVKPDEYEIEVVRTPGLSAGTLTFKNKLFMQNVFFQSENGGIHFKENFESYLPGTHTINFTLDPNVKTGSVFLQHL